MTRKIPSYLLVISQFICIGILVFIYHPSSVNLFSYIVMSIGVLIGLWAILVMQKSHLTIMPDYVPGSRLIKSGPYKFIRHPMYLAVIVFCTSLVINEFSVLRIGILLFLILTLLVKIEYEEKQLIAGYDEYLIYTQRTKKLIPLLY